MRHSPRHTNGQLRRLRVRSHTTWGPACMRYAHARARAHVHVRTYVHTYTCTCAQASARYARARTCACTVLRICIRTCTCTYMSACARAQSTLHNTLTNLAGPQPLLFYVIEKWHVKKLSHVMSKSVSSRQKQQLKVTMLHFWAWQPPQWSTRSWDKYPCRYGPRPRPHPLHRCPPPSWTLPASDRCCRERWRQPSLPKHCPCCGDPPHNQRRSVDSIHITEQIIMRPTLGKGTIYEKKVSFTHHRVQIFFHTMVHKMILHKCPLSQSRSFCTPF